MKLTFGNIKKMDYAEDIPFEFVLVVDEEIEEFKKFLEE